MANEKENKAVGQVVTNPVQPGEVTPNAEADLIKSNAHGVDETGAAAPDQVDQVRINQEKLNDPDKRDPRWPAGEPIKAVLPEETEHGKALNEDFNKQKEEAQASGPHNPPMGKDSSAGEKK